jgi:methylase of polypeptide subunit release factors
VLPDNNNQTPYAIVKLEEAARTVKQVINEFTSLRKKLDKVKNNKTKAQEVYADLQQQFGRLKNALDTSTLALLEMELPDIADYSAKLTRAVKGFNLMTPDYGKLCKTLSDYLAKLPLSDTKAKTTNAAIIGRLMATVKMGYYPTDMEHAKLIALSIEFPEGVTVNLLDPCCGCGLALQTLARRHECNTYGVELDRHRAEEAITRLNRVGFGSYFHSRISQETFHLMLLNPPYLSVMAANGSNARSEKRFLIDCYSHLMYGGLMIYIIPYYRLTSDVCRVLCDNFEDLTVWKFMGGEFKKFKQIAVMGLRCKRRDGSKLVQELASLALKPDTLRELSELPKGRYRLPETAVKVNTFKGAQFNVYEMAEQLKRSASFSKLFEKNKLDSTCKRPLLPLNIGQVGLIGGSGLINGLVECGTPHIIKGRVVKEIVVSKEGNLNSKGDFVSTTVTEIRSNKMIFNLLTPQGFISLSDYGNQDMDDDKSATA